MINVVLIFKEAKLKTSYTIVFKGCNAHMGQEFEIEYIGTEVNFRSGWVGLTDKQEKKLKKYLNKQYGYGPFDKKEVKKELENNNRYEL